jgi:DNA-binding Xre family transcriptional regulator
MIAPATLVSQDRIGEKSIGVLLMRLQLHIREIATKQGVTRTKLSRLADLNYATINALWGDEISSVNLVTLEKIARVLKVRVSDLYTRIEEDE